MTTLRTAAQQALAALEKATRFMSDSDYKKLNETIEILRAALAEQEPFKPDWDRVEALQESLREHMSEIQRLRATLAESAQEPVAWMDIDSDGQRLAVRQWSDGNRDEVPLYTAPPQRKPLTYEKILRMWIDATKPERHTNEMILAFVRALERAHGIGEQR